MQFQTSYDLGFCNFRLIFQKENDYWNFFIFIFSFKSSSLLLKDFINLFHSKLLWKISSTLFCFCFAFFVFRAILFALRLEHAKCGCSKPKCTFDRGITRNIDFYSSLPKQACSFHFKWVSIKNICNDAFVVWMLFRCLK